MLMGVTQGNTEDMKTEGSTREERGGEETRGMGDRQSNKYLFSSSAFTFNPKLSPNPPYVS